MNAREIALDNGFTNALDTFCEKTETREEIANGIAGYLRDGLCCDDFDDFVSDEEIALYRRLFISQTAYDANGQYVPFLG